MAGRLPTVVDVSPVAEPGAARTVTLTLDGERVFAERGEPVAAALVAAGKWTLARSPKFHRPRGPSCMRGACDGCLARVDGVPNVMTCLVPAEEGLVVTSQNTLGSRELDLLRMTDWFFPDGMNHHELFAGVPGVQAAMQLFARRVAGLGRLPTASRETNGAPSIGPAARRRAGVVIIGAGAAGMAMAVAATGRGHSVEVVDDAIAPGGNQRAFVGSTDPAFGTIRERFERAVASGQVTIRSRTIAAGFFGRELLVIEAGATGAAEIVEADAFVVAAGAHDGVMPFENNDLPGVMSARAGCLLVAAGVSLGKKVTMLVPAGSPEEAAVPSFADLFEQAVSAAGTRVTRVTEVVRVKGSSSVRAVVVMEAGRERPFPTDALLVDAPRSPAYELCEQAGASLVHRPSGYIPVLERGLVAPGVWAIGEVTGAPLSAGGFVRSAEEIALSLPPARRTA